MMLQIFKEDNETWHKFLETMVVIATKYQADRIWTVSFKCWKQSGWALWTHGTTMKKRSPLFIKEMKKKLRCTHVIWTKFCLNIAWPFIWLEHATFLASFPQHTNISWGSMDAMVMVICLLQKQRKSKIWMPIFRRVDILQLLIFSQLGWLKTFCLAKNLFVKASGIQQWTKKLGYPENIFTVPTPTIALVKHLKKKKLPAICHSIMTFFGT